MNNLKKMVIMTFLTAVIIMLPFFIVAGAPKIVSVTMIPANPQFGDFVQVAVTMCCNKYTDTYIAIAFSTFTTLGSLDAAPMGAGANFVSPAQHFPEPELVSSFA